MIMNKERNMNNNVDERLWIPVYETLPETTYPLTSKPFDVKLVLFGALSKEYRVF